MDVRSLAWAWFLFQSHHNCAVDEWKKRANYHVCMRICMLRCMYACMYVRMSVCLYAFMHACTYACMLMDFSIAGFQLMFFPSLNFLLKRSQIINFSWISQFLVFHGRFSQFKFPFEK